MARPGLTQHRKFLRLARMLGSAPLALGCLELIWEKCYQNGDDYLGDVTDVEAAAQWPGDPGVLCHALVTAGGEGNVGFIEQLDERQDNYRCHDLFDHAPRYVTRRLERELDRESKGTTIAQLRSLAGRKGADKTNHKLSANGQQMASKWPDGPGKWPANGRQIAVTPAPAPKKIRAPSGALCPEREAPSGPDSMEEVDFLLEIPCTGLKKTWPLTKSKRDEWAGVYPGLDVDSEIRRAIQWLNDNPDRRKTYRGMPAFLGSWLGRAQDRRGGRSSFGGNTNGNNHLRSETDGAYLRQLERIEGGAQPPAGPDHSESNAETLRALLG